MEFVINTYMAEMNCKLDGQTLTCEGIVWRKYTSLKFSPGALVKMNFNRKEVTARLKKFTSKNAILEYNGKTKSVEITQFAFQNRLTEICIRLEKDNYGPYRSPEGSVELQKWRDSIRKERHERLSEGINYIQPAPEEDSLMKDYPMIGSSSIFGFSDFEQLFKWFSLQETCFLIKEGFKVVVKQKGIDYFNSFKSYDQVAMVKDEETYNKILNYKRSYYG